MLLIVDPMACALQDESWEQRCRSRPRFSGHAGYKSRLASFNHGGTVFFSPGRVDFSGAQHVAGRDGGMNLETKSTLRYVRGGGLRCKHEFPPVEAKIRLTSAPRISQQSRPKKMRQLTGLCMTVSAARRNCVIALAAEKKRTSLAPTGPHGLFSRFPGRCRGNHSSILDVARRPILSRVQNLACLL